MRKIIIVSFLSMDGILQAPGGADEDRTNGFKYGGWQFGYQDELAEKVLGKIMSSSFDLLLGRRTYEIFSAFWPYQQDEIGKKFDQVTKFVVGTTPIDTSWKNTVLINKDVVNELKKLKAQDGPDLLVHGSSGLAKTLFANRLVDVLQTWIYPITLGKGKRLFGDGVAAHEWQLTESIISSKGIIWANYVPGGEVKLGSYVPDKVSDKEIERREKWQREEQSE